MRLALQPNHDQVPVIGRDETGHILPIRHLTWDTEQPLVAPRFNCTRDDWREGIGRCYPTSGCWLGPRVDPDAHTVNPADGLRLKADLTIQNGQTSHESRDGREDVPIRTLAVQLDTQALADIVNAPALVLARVRLEECRSTQCILKNCRPDGLGERVFGGHS